jgi:hypothetical protein
VRPWSTGAATWPSPAWSTPTPTSTRPSGGCRGGRTPPGPGLAELIANEQATAGGAAVLRLDGHGLDPGCWADLTLFLAATVAEAVVAHPPRSPGAQARPGVAGP